MKNTITKILLLFILVASHFALYVFGTVIGQRTSTESFVRATEQMDAKIELGSYKIYRDIAKSIKNGKHEDAKCLAELQASSLYHDISICLLDANCKQSIEKMAMNVAPEFFNKSDPGFVVINKENGLWKCK